MIVARARLRLAANRTRRYRFAVAFSSLLLVLFFFRLGHRDLYSSHEARAAQNAQRMLDTGECQPVLFDGQIDLQKPPGYYWLAAVCGWLNGGRVDALAVRLPAALAGLATVVMVYLFLRQAGRPTAAVVAAVALATAVHLTGIARTARIDVPLTCAVTAALLAFHRGCTTQWSRLGWHLLSAVAAAAGVLLKGPIALALVGPVAVGWLVAVRGMRLPISSAVLGPLVVGAVAAPWFVWANHATGGEFGRVFFWHHNVERFAGTSPTLASHPWWYYAPRFAVDFLPWTPALAGLVVWAVRSGRWRTDPHLRLGVVWFGVMFAVLSAARFKRADYLLPLYPGAAIALGCAAESWLATRTYPRTVRTSKVVSAAVVGLVVVGWQVMTFVVEPAEQAREEKRAFAAAVRELAPPPNEVLLFRTEPHLLAYHLGRPLRSRVEWHDLNDWLAGPGPRVVVMPP
ncbi:MAG: glycosyltransferase family 39 protein, partial [Gemmataceae bacterium]|nr:glycosyltransferase family 39 protein [Gemmataceae bacterium]